MGLSGLIYVRALPISAGVSHSSVIRRTLDDLMASLCCCHPLSGKSELSHMLAGLKSKRGEICYILSVETGHKTKPDLKCGEIVFYFLMRRAEKSHRKGYSYYGEVNWGHWCFRTQKIIPFSCFRVLDFGVLDILCSVTFQLLPLWEKGKVSLWPYPVLLSSYLLLSFLWP